MGVENRSETPLAIANEFFEYLYSFSYRIVIAKFLRVFNFLGLRSVLITEIPQKVKYGY